MRWMVSDKYMILKRGLFLSSEIHDIGLLRWNLETPDMIRMRSTIHRARINKFNSYLRVALSGGQLSRDDAEETAYNQLSVWCTSHGKAMTFIQFLEFYKLLKAGR